MIDNYRLKKINKNAHEENENIATTGADDYLNSIKPQVAKTALDKKSKSEEYEQCSSCVKELYAGVRGLFVLTTNRSAEKTESGKIAVAVFGAGWEKFVLCWNKCAKEPATQEELDELKTSFSGSLENSIDDVIKSQAISKQLTEKRRTEIENRIRKRSKK